MPERHPGWVNGINDFEARLATGALVAPHETLDQLDPLRVRSGVRDSPGMPGALTVSTNRVTVNPFQAIIQDRARPGLGAYLVTLDAPKELPIEAVSQGNRRVDLVIAEVVDGGDPGFAVSIVKGTETTATPTAPVPGNPLHLKLGQLTVAASGTPTFNDLRQFTAAAGGILPVRGAEDRPRGDGGPLSQFIYRLDTKELQVRIGNSWVTYRPPRGSVDTWHAVTFLNTWANWGGNHTPCAYTITEDGWVHIRGLIRNATAANLTRPIFQLPSGYRPTHQYIFAVKCNGGSMGRLDIATDGNVFNGATNDGPLNGGWTCLDGISFATY